MTDKELVHQLVVDACRKALGDYSKKDERAFAVFVLRALADKVESLEPLQGFDMSWRMGNPTIDLTEVYVPDKPLNFIKIDITI